MVGFTRLETGTVLGKQAVGEPVGSIVRGDRWIVKAAGMKIFPEDGGLAATVMGRLLRAQVQMLQKAVRALQQERKT